MTDQSELKQGFQLAPHSEAKYERKSWEYIRDPNINGGNYQYNFNTDNITDKTIVWSTAYFSIPLTLTETGAGDAWDLEGVGVGPLVALKNSITSLVYNLRVTANGADVLNVDHVNRMALVNQLFQYNVAHMGSHGSELHFAKDKMYGFEGRPIADTHFAAAGSVAAAVNSMLSAAVKGVYADRVNGEHNALKGMNVGLVKRTEMLEKYVNSATQYKFKAIIPLRLLSPFFDNLDFPLSGVSMRVETKLTIGTWQAEFNPLCISTGKPFGTAANVVAKDGLWAVDTAEEARLYYEHVQLNAEQGRLYAEAKASGLVKQLRYYDHVKYRYSQSTTASANIRWMINPAIARARRVTIIMTPHINNGLGAQASQLSSPYAAGLAYAGMTNFQLYIDNEPYYKSPIRTDEEFYNLMKDNMLDQNEDPSSAGSLFSFEDFQNGHRIYQFDISRSRSSDPNKLVSVYVEFDRVGGINPDVKSQMQSANLVPVDLDALIEYETVTEVNQSTGVIRRTT